MGIDRDFDNLMDGEGDRDREHPGDYWDGFQDGSEAACDTGYVEGRMDGAAVAFGLMGMAEAIRMRPHPQPREYWSCPGSARLDARQFYTGWCSRCGDQLKNRRAGEDDLTPYDWCGQHWWEAKWWA